MRFCRVHGHFRYSARVNSTIRRSWCRKFLIANLAFLLVAGAALGQDDSLRALLDKATAGDVAAQLAIAKKYDNGDGVPENTEKAAYWFRKAAEQGNADAQNSLGVCYRMGRGVDKDPAEAMKWYRLAAAQGNPSAFFNLGAAYYNGDSAAIDDRAAYIWFWLAKHAGVDRGAEAVARMEKELSPEALVRDRLFLAQQLASGALGKPEPEQAIAIYDDLASQGNPSALIRLAKIYLDGKVVPKDVARGESYCQRAADLKYSAGLVCLGFLFQTGIHGPDRSGEAIKLYEQAFELGGDPVAAYSLGVMYAKGTGVRQDLPKAYVWFAVAASSRLQEASQARDVVSSRLDPKQIKKLGQEAQSKITKYYSTPHKGPSPADGEQFALAVKLDSVP